MSENKSVSSQSSSPFVTRSPQTIRQEGNRLTGESSLYLLQHSHNPVDWYPWGEEAKIRSGAEDKPIFLSIGYSSCHWCHVMEHEVFEVDSIAEFMNEHFINIKVDREERPDLDAVYMEAVRAMTGGGGWPMSVFLTSDLKPFYGGTYFPPDQFVRLVKSISDTYGEQRDKIELQSEQLYKMVSSNPQLSQGQAVNSPDFSSIANNSLQFVDAKWGGFRGRMKFPTPLRWQFLLHRYRKTGEARIADAVRKTLNNMGTGGIHDHVGGGFHRYTVEETWLVPHFEKMLYDNAQLASLYIEAFAVFGKRNGKPHQPGYDDIAKNTLDFLIRDMQSSSGGFYASYDADSGGEEGTFYTWSPDEITDIAGKKDGAALANLLGVELGGNFEGKSILTRRKAYEKIAREFDRDIQEVNVLFEKWREELRNYRAKRVPPGLDKKVVTAWNGLAIAAFSQGYALFGEEKYRDAAREAIEYLWHNHRLENGSLVRASNEGVTSGVGILDDYAFFANGLLEFYNATGEIETLEMALELTGHVRDHFASDEGGYYLTSNEIETPMGRQVEIYDSVEPSGNSAMLNVLLRLSALTGNQTYRKDVERMLGAYSDMVNKSGLEMALWLDVAQNYEGPFHEVIIAGQLDDNNTNAMINVFRGLLPSYAVLTLIPPDGPDKKMQTIIPSTVEKTMLNGETTVYVCEFGSCKAPTNDPEEFKQQLLEGWKL
ncbi:MAG: thioredoxin domain-containing protein [Candidatus Electryonea clarkiae]|nr:thioredoxin domain-containing protein [Candidatus Electryonea clarkiae]